MEALLWGWNRDLCSPSGHRHLLGPIPAHVAEPHVCPDLHLDQRRKGQGGGAGLGLGSHWHPILWIPEGQ